jgi:NAD(P)-dependent dehydrogenase (short-subunit alcohol dehydrogenase family)
MITGGAKRIGADIARHFAKNGANIIIHYNTSDADAEQLQEELWKCNVKITLIKCDFNKPYDITLMFNNLVKLGVDTIDILINNAAIFEKNTINTLDYTAILKSFNVNVFSPMLCTHECINFGVKLVVNMSDTTTVKNGQNFLSHSLSKKSIIDFTKTAAKSLAPNTRINCIVLGLILDDTNEANANFDSLVKKTPMKMSGSVDNITSTIDYLWNNEYITGSIINVDGGLTL